MGGASVEGRGLGGAAGSGRPSGRRAGRQASRRRARRIEPSTRARSCCVPAWPWPRRPCKCASWAPATGELRRVVACTLPPGSPRKEGPAALQAPGTAGHAGWLEQLRSGRAFAYPERPCRGTKPGGSRPRRKRGTCHLPTHPWATCLQTGICLLAPHRALLFSLSFMHPQMCASAFSSQFPIPDRRFEPCQARRVEHSCGGSCQVEET